MTDDFKLSLLKYFTGNLKQETGDNTPQFGGVEEVTNNLTTYLTANFGTSGQFFITSFTQAKNSNNEGLDLFVLTGRSTNNKYPNPYGFIVLLDREFNPIQAITTFSSGTVLGQILSFGIDEEGKFFGIEQAYGTSTKRFIMLNNISAKLPNQTEYNVVLKTSYNLPAPISNSEKYYQMVKAIGSSKYLIVSTFNDSRQRPQPLVTELTVNVGSSNEWKNYQLTYETTTYVPSDLWANWDGEGNIDFKSIGFTFNDDGGQEYTEYWKSGDNGLGRFVTPLDYTLINGAKAVIIGKQQVYIAIYYVEEANHDVFELFKFNYNAMVKESIYQKTAVYTGDLSNLCSIALNRAGVNVYYEMIYALDDNIETFNLDIGRIVDTNVFNYNLKQLTIDDTSTTVILNLFEQFNLYIYYVQIGDKAYMSRQVYNIFNYNGNNYENNNSMIPKAGELYNSDNKLIFARNLYNISINANTTLSSLRVPNTMLNDETINNSLLKSETNLILNNNTKNINKNIYESLTVNFYNTLKIQDRNTTNYINNQIGSNRINQSVSKEKDYSSAKANIVKINFADGTNRIFNLIPTIENMKANYIFALKVDKEITNIEIMSSDKLTVYQTIKPNFEIGKKYNIIQEVTII